MKRHRRKLLVAALAAALALPGVGRATHGGCEFSGTNGSYKVGKFTLAGLTEIRSMAWRQKDPVQFPFTDREGYIAVLGYFIVDASTRQAVLWVVHVGGAGAPGAVVRVGGTTYYDGGFPSTAASGVNGGLDGLVGGSLRAGTYYVVGFGWGAKEGLLSVTGPGTWSVSIRVNAEAPCTMVDAPGELMSFNQTDFEGATQIYVPSAGVGSGLSLMRSISRNTVLGSLYAAEDTQLGRSMDLRYTTPTGSGRLGTVNHKGISHLSSLRGLYSFLLDYYGVDPLVNITLLAVDL